MRIGTRELQAEIAFLQKEVNRLKSELAAKEWQPMKTVPIDGTFLIAEFAPTSWAYWIKYIHPYAYMEPEARQKLIKNQCRYARAWMPAPEPPGPHGTGWYEES